jgi:multidrug efflux pump subunit AcrB
VLIDGGRIPPSVKEVRKAALVINYTPKSSRSHSVHDIELAIGKELDDVPDIHYWFLDENGRRAISFIVKGPDGTKVSNFAAELATRARSIPIITNVVAGTSLDRPELLIKPKRDLAARLGVSTEGLSKTLRIATIGDFGPALAKLNTDNQLVPIRVQLDEDARTDRQVLGNLRVPTGAGSSISLQSIADIELSQGPISISRFDRERQATLQADLVGEAALGDATAAIKNLPMMKQKPPGISADVEGDAETMDELLSGFASAMRDGLMMVYSVLVLLFGSFLQPVTILFSLPLSIGGAILGLLVTRHTLSMPVVIGILMLMGIVTKNAIMLVDFTIESIASGMDRTKAIVEAGKKRARPIIMTTIAMVAGMLPSAFAIGAGGEFRSPMAIAVIGGLIVSTVLSLLFVPAFFAMMDDIGLLFLKGWNRFSLLEGNAALAPRAAVRSPESSGGVAGYLNNLMKLLSKLLNKAQSQPRKKEPPEASHGRHEQSDP